MEEKKENLTEMRQANPGSEHGGTPGVKCEATPDKVFEGGEVVLQVPEEYRDAENFSYKWSVGGYGALNKDNAPLVIWDTTGVISNVYDATVNIYSEKGIEVATGKVSITVATRPVAKGDTIAVTMKRTAAEDTKDLALWVVIRNSALAISFSAYKEFVDGIMCKNEDPAKLTGGKAPSSSVPFPFVDAYKRLKTASEVFLMLYCGVTIDFMGFINKLDPATKASLLREESLRFRHSVDSNFINNLWQAYLETVNGTKTLPYLSLIREKLGEIPLKDAEARWCYGILTEKLSRPCLLELIWSYWHEEGMLVQTLNAISLRFQNKRIHPGRDPLVHLDIDPLRPLNNLLWGYIQDEQHRLTLARRTYEYDHHYGLRLLGKAVPELRAVDSRSKFLEAFHNLLHICSIFFTQDDDTTVVADGFPALNALKEVHLLLAEGAHNQFGDLPSTARMEMLMQQWLLSRPEMREFLSSRVMVPYQEQWMDRVDTMKKLQGWTDVTVIHFHDLAAFGEQILLSIRYGSWNEVHNPLQAANWARYWRSEIQSYIHAYQAVTGVDLTAQITDTRQLATRYLSPSVHLARRLATQMRS
jgi:hypothetical protein